MATNNTGNSLLDDADSLLKSFTNAGQNAANIYSTFLGAKSNLILAQAQKADAQKVNSFSPEQEDIFKLGGNAVTYVVYAAIALAVIGTGVVIYRAAKK